MKSQRIRVLSFWVVGLIAGLMGFNEANGQTDGGSPSLCLEVKLISDDLAERDTFGEAVSTDGNVAAISTGDNPVATNPEVVYVFRRHASGWVQEARITTPAAFVDDVREFGTDVAIRGDVLVIGANGQFFGGGVYTPGSAFVYRYSPDISQWLFETVLHGTDEAGTQSRLFGITVAINESSNRIAIGSGGRTLSGKGVLLAYVFKHTPGGDWTDEARLPISSVTDQLAIWSPANWLDLTDKYLIGGSPHSPFPEATKSDEAFIYRLNQADSTWHVEAHLLPPPEESESFFGFGVSVHGDVAAIIAPNENGAVYRRNADGNWIKETILTVSPHGFLGLDVDVQGNTILASGRRGSSEKVVFIFRFDGEQWKLDSTALGDGLANLDSGFARRIDAGGDALLVGSHFDDANSPFAGAAYIFAGTDQNDCNRNGIADACDLLATTSFDDNANSIPDECEPPTCEGLTATVYIDQFGFIVGGPLEGMPYFGVLIGTNGDDVIVGTENDDLIIARHGDDVICGNGGNDRIITSGPSRSRRDGIKPLRIRHQRE